MSTEEFVFSVEMLETADVLCLFGFDAVKIKKQLESWTSLGDKQIVFIDKKRTDEFEDFLEISRKRVFQKFSYLVFPFLKEMEKQTMESLLLQYQAMEWHTHLEASDYQDLGIKVFRNLCANHTKKTDIKRFPLLKDCLKGIPAFICGASPSLKKAATLIGKMQDKGVIFAGGSAIGAASSYSIPIHIAAGIDPSPSYERCVMQGSFEAPFFYQSRFSSELLDRMQGPLFQVPSHSGLNIDENFLGFDGGCTVTTFCASLALYFGCTPIIFTGMDLAYEAGGGKYLGEISLGSSVLYEEKTTQKDWVIAARWLENLAANHNHVPFYRLSEEGLHIEGIQKISFEELEKMALPSYDVQGMVHVLKSLEGVSDSFLEERLKKVDAIQKSLKDSLACVERILFLFQESYPQDPSSQGTFILHLFALYDEIVYQYLLEPLWKVWRFPLERNLSNSYARQIHQWLFFKRVLENHLL